jgi:hypothetical protein
MTINLDDLPEGGEICFIGEGGYFVLSIFKSNKGKWGITRYSHLPPSCFAVNPAGQIRNLTDREKEGL